MNERLQLALTTLIILMVVWLASKLGELCRGIKQGMDDFDKDPHYHR